MDWVANEPAIRMIAFAVVLSTMAALEAWLPRRSRGHSRASRWTGNLGLIVVSSALIKLIFPLTAVAFALFCESRGIGLLHAVPTSSWIGVPLAIMLLDLAIYAQHVVFHRIPLLWRLHRMHHADLDFDTTTGIRFHPAEMLLSMAIKFAVIAALGTPALAVLLFEVLLNATALFSHANMKLPAGLDQLLRLVLVTPDMHRVHHSVIPHETHSNFGFCLPWWDRLFRTYRAQPEAGHEAMKIGLPVLRDPAELRIDRLITQPFRDAK